VGVNSSTNTIYVASPAGVTVLDGTTNTIAAKITDGYSPTQVAMNPTTTLVYVTDPSDDTVSVIGSQLSRRTTVSGIQGRRDVVERVARHQPAVGDWPTERLVEVTSGDGASPTTS
jgi:DNA-binding beta-propeller fold protein YncE